MSHNRAVIQKLQLFACGTAFLSVLSYAAAASALELEFPAAANLVSSVSGLTTRHPMATGVFDGATVPTETATGQVREFTWHIDGAEVGSLSVSLRAQIEAQGFTIPFTCAARDCGGFDFRHRLPLGQAPDMLIDLGNFSYLTAMRDGEDGMHFAVLTVSQGGDTGFVHLALIQPETEDAAPVVQSTRSPDPEAPGIQLPEGGLIETLITQGGVALDDLVFETGASELSGERYESLVALAEFLTADPTRRVVLVGHTDALGSLAGNIALSRARAGAVRRFLIEEFGIASEQVEAEGIGYLSPRATNDTADGREANRRVEVVLAQP